MPLFKIVLHTQAKAFIESLGKRSTFRAMTINPETQDLIIEWEDDQFFTGLTVPTDWPLELFKAGKLPQGVKKLAEHQKAVAAAQKPKPAPEAKQEPAKPIVAPLYLTEDELAECVAKNIPVEFQGVQPVWKPFDLMKDVYREGYFYRKAVKNKVDMNL